MLVELRTVRIAITISASAPVFLIRPCNDANSPTRLQTKLLDELDRFPRGDDSPAIVHRTLTHIPRIDVSAEYDDFIRFLRSADFGDDISRRRIRQSLRGH